MDLFETLGKTLKPVTTLTKEFKVGAVSVNSNSFGLKQMIMVAKDGTAFKACFNYLNVKKEKETINASIILNEDGKVISTSFVGGELIEQISDAPKEIIEELWN